MNPIATPPPASSVESMMYALSQLFLTPVLIVIALLFLYAFFALGAFSLQAWQRRRGEPAAFELIQMSLRAPALPLSELEAEAVTRLEFVRIVTRVAPMLGLVATMIPMGPALQALGAGQLGDVAGKLAVAFSAVILALLASAITYWIANVRRRWYARDLMFIENSVQGVKS
ncbi:MAG: MotA/TolQ/ExbB proton channel family protein [Burkholderiaceae bacterium]|nr:MotA/TolQ/ExbB proton channel family protein [Burkholderiaceae bacterium]